MAHRSGLTERHDTHKLAGLRCSSRELRFSISKSRAIIVISFAIGLSLSLTGCSGRTLPELIQARPLR